MSKILFHDYPPVPMHFGGTEQFAASVLGNEDWYRDLPAPWAGAPTRDDALRQVAADSRRLLRHPVCDAVPDAVTTANAMLNCSPGQRCGICAACRRVLQIASTKQDLTLISRAGDGIGIYKYTYVPAVGRVRPGNIGILPFLAVVAGVEGPLPRHSGVDWIKGAIDVCFSDDTQKDMGKAWQIHVHGVAAAVSREALGTALSERAGSAATIYRPVQTSICDGSAYALSYSYKTSFYRRVAFWAGGGQRGCWRSAHRPLLARQHARLLVALARLGAARRIISYGRLNGGSYEAH